MSNEIATITSQIVILPGRPPVMLDRDVAVVYNTTTSRINQAVKRNKKRFPAHFCFQLTPEEFSKVVTDCDHLEDQPITDCDRFEALKHVPTAPYAFTREGCNMLAMVLHTAIATDRSIWIIEAFTMFEKKAHKSGEDAPPSPLLPNGWQMHCLIKIHGIEGADIILRDWWGIHPDAFKDRISPYESSVIRKDNPNKLHRDQCIFALAGRGVAFDLIANLSGFARQRVAGIVKTMKLIADSSNIRPLKD